jgi:17beta-estradiol 17-dehydrogenase / very-long-chain 3-oxoacyl-CoA reductase
MFFYNLFKFLSSIQSPLKEFILLVGIISSLLIISEFTSGLLRQIRRRFPLDVLKRYGEGSWALVTGASDGIGKSFAHQLAKRGFNLILLARNRDKIEKIRNEIWAINNKIQMKIVIADLADSDKEGFFDDLMNQIQDLDISMFVNNAGLVFMDRFHNGTEKEFRDVLTVNVIPAVLLTRRLMDKFRARAKNGKKSGIVVVSSLTCLAPMPYMAVYGSTKALEDYFIRSLAVEYPEIDMISLRPYFVNTKSTGYGDISIDTISHEKCAEGTLRDLGRYIVTGANIKHDLAGWTVTKLHPFILNFIVKHVLIPFEWKRMETEKKKNFEQKSK